MSDDETTHEVKASDGVEIDSAARSDAATGEASETPQRRAISLIPLALVVGLVAAGALAGWLYVSQYRPDRQVDHAVERRAVDAARDGTIALLSYKPETLDKDLAAARARTGGDFADYYEKFSKDVITPAAQTKGVATQAQVVGAAAKDLHPDSAVVLVFVNQVTTSKERPDPAMAASSILVSVNKQHGDWLITKFDPI